MLSKLAIELYRTRLISSNKSKHKNNYEQVKKLKKKTPIDNAQSLEETYRNPDI